MIDLDNLERLRSEAESYIELETRGMAYLTYEVPTDESKAFHEAAHNALPALLAVARAAVAYIDALDTKNATLINEAEDDLICTVRVNLKEAP